MIFLAYNYFCHARQINEELGLLAFILKFNRYIIFIETTLKLVLFGVHSVHMASAEY